MTERGDDQILPSATSLPKNPPYSVWIDGRFDRVVEEFVVQDSEIYGRYVALDSQKFWLHKPPAGTRIPERTLLLTTASPVAGSYGSPEWVRDQNEQRRREQNAPKRAATPPPRLPEDSVWKVQPGALVEMPEPAESDVAKQLRIANLLSVRRMSSGEASDQAWESALRELGLDG